MTKCKFNACGWCYAPNSLITNANQGQCNQPNKCPSNTGGMQVNKYKQFTLVDNTTKSVTDMFDVADVLGMLSEPDVDAEFFLREVSVMSKFYDIIVDDFVISVVDKE